MRIARDWHFAPRNDAGTHGAGLVGATLLAGRHARHLAGRAQTLQDARKPMQTLTLNLWSMFGYDEMWSWVFRLSC